MSLKYFLPAIFWAIAIAILSLMPSDQLPDLHFDLMAPDKLAHAFVYFLLCSLIVWALSRIKKLNFSTVLWCLAGCASYGISLEFVQDFFFPSRYFEVYDIIANIIGTFSGLLVLIFLK